MSDSLIIDSIGFWYKNGPRLLNNFSIVLEPGSLFLIQGENGSGKSTLLKILSTLFIPRKGRIQLGTLDFEKEPHKIRPWIGFGSGPQQGFYPTLKGVQNLRFFYGLRAHGARFPIEQALGLAERLGLAKEAFNQPVREYSNGMRQKLGLIRAFLGQPKLILLDEPFSCLDTGSERSLTELISEYRAAKTSILILASPKADCAQLFLTPPDHHLKLGEN